MRPKVDLALNLHDESGGNLAMHDNENFETLGLSNHDYFVSKRALLSLETNPIVFEMCPPTRYPMCLKCITDSTCQAPCLEAGELSPIQATVHHETSSHHPSIRYFLVYPGTCIQPFANASLVVLASSTKFLPIIIFKPHPIE